MIFRRSYFNAKFLPSLLALAVKAQGGAAGGGNSSDCLDLIRDLMKKKDRIPKNLVPKFAVLLE